MQKNFEKTEKTPENTEIVRFDREGREYAQKSKSKSVQKRENIGFYPSFISKGIVQDAQK